MRAQLTAVEAFSLVARRTFRPFDRSDAMAFAGAESDHPLISDSADTAELREDLLVVLDGDRVEFYDADGKIVFNGSLRGRIA